MNTFVYLFELDSVCNSVAQIERAQKALFEEIVLNGNIVVLSQNQLSDSKGFLAPLADDDTEVFDHILDLCRRKWIRVSLYQGFLSPSQYLQTQFESHPDFIFSMFRDISFDADIQKSIQYCVHQALKYSDYKWLEKLPPDLTVQQKSFLKRYVRLILALSSSDVPLNPAGTAPFTLSSLIRQAMERVDSRTAQDLQQAQSQLDEDQQNRRSCWYPLLQSRESRLVVDLCYNYRVEASIKDAARHYDQPFDDSFWSDFSQRLARYTATCTGAEETSLFDFDLNLSFWHTANRICTSTARDTPVVERYEHNWRRDRFRNGLRLLGVNLKILATVVLLFFTFVLLAIALNFAQDSVQQQVYDTFTGGNMNWVVLFIFTILFSLVSSGIGAIAHIPDILDTVRNFCFLFVDYGRIIFFKRGSSWRNHDR